MTTKEVIFVIQAGLTSVPVAGSDAVKVHRLINFCQVWLPKRAKLDRKTVPLLRAGVTKPVYRARVFAVPLLRRPFRQGKLRLKAVRHYLLLVNLFVAAQRAFKLYWRPLFHFAGLRHSAMVAVPVRLPVPITLRHLAIKVAVKAPKPLKAIAPPIHPGQVTFKHTRLCLP